LANRYSKTSKQSHTADNSGFTRDTVRVTADECFVTRWQRRQLNWISLKTCLADEVMWPYGDIPIVSDGIRLTETYLERCVFRRLQCVYPQVTQLPVDATQHNTPNQPPDKTWSRETQSSLVTQLVHKLLIMQS